MANQFHAQILTPVGKVYEGDVIGVQVPGEAGSFEVKVNHAALIATLDIGAVRLTTPEKQNKYFAISGGFVEMNDNKLTLLAEAAEEAGNIDIERARSARERALGKLSDKRQKLEHDRMQRALRRADNRLKVAEKNA